MSHVINIFNSILKNGAHTILQRHTKKWFNKINEIVKTVLRNYSMKDKKIQKCCLTQQNIDFGRARVDN